MHAVKLPILAIGFKIKRFIEGWQPCYSCKSKIPDVPK